ncbi:MAG: hypothetical protein BGP11_08515 [Rhodobacterales bacterium 65-51]|uniref:hypothetical protein n=1 Tax=uncultured Gemmobacter sp. TaxID=1095917 RepID=UPI00095AD0C2|nr:hypothetical protein [uncultured Gemmobacter sp.]OJY34649.1 MAG: hypothetical protein BGP11_08515 [Rhodobacterales bacterium 65-51]
MAAQAIGSLFVALGLDSAAFQAGIKQVQSQATAFAGRLGKALGAAAAAAVPAMTAIGVAAANAGAEIKRAAQLANAAPEEFQGWAAGAQSVGIEQEKLADILKDVNDRVGDFIATGGGPMADFFERVAPLVGVTADQFRNLSGPQALQLYVDSLQKANLNQQDFTFFMEAMASDSTALVPLLRDGGKAMAEYAAKAAALGVVLDSNTVASFARAKQSFSEVQMALTGFRNLIAAQVVPVLNALAQAFVTASQEGHWLGDMVRTFAAIIPRLSAYIGTFLAFMGAKWVAAFAAAKIATISLSTALVTLRGALIRTGLGALIIVAGEVVYRMGEVVGAVGGVSGALAALKNVASEVWSRIGDGVSYVTNSVAAMSSSIQAFFIGALNRMAGAWVEFTWTIADGLNSLFGMSLQGADARITQSLLKSQMAAEDAAAGYRDAASAAADAFSAPLKSVAAIGEQVAASAVNAANGMSVLGDGLDAAGGSGSGAAGKLSKLQEVMKALREEAEKLRATVGMTDLQAEIWGKQKEAGVSASSEAGKVISDTLTQIDGLKKLKEATDDWRDSISNAFSEFILKGGSFKQVLSQIIGKLAEMVFSSGFQNLFNGLGGGGILGGILGSLGIGANADGTNNWRGGLTQVNERGGEIMNLPRGTQIIPHDISKRMADSAASRSQSIQIGWDDSIGNFRATVRDEAGRVVAQATPGMVGQAVAATYRRAQEVPIG